jgi:hypothetical protein
MIRVYAHKPTPHLPSLSSTGEPQEDERKLAVEGGGGGGSGAESDDRK